MIIEASSVAGGQALETDICIVGAGPAGITLALELAAAGTSVVLLESGGDAREPETQALYEGETTGAPQYPTQLSRLRFLGGTSNHWAGQCRPLEPIDFERRSWVADSGWPITPSELAPYYVRANAVCEMRPVGFGLSDWPEQQPMQDLLTPDPEVELKIFQHSPPTRFGQRDRERLSESTRIQLILHANVTTLEPSPDGGRVSEAEVRTLDGHAFGVRARRFVLAAGGLENARLLLLSQNLMQRGLGREAALVGRYYMDHPGVMPFGTLVYLDRRAQIIDTARVERGMRLARGIAFTAEAQRRMEILGSILYVRKADTLEAIREFKTFNIVNVIESDLDDESIQAARFIRALAPEARRGEASLCWIRSEQAPNRDSRVGLSDELDALGQRRIVVDWQIGAATQRSLRQAALRYSEVLARCGIGRVHLAPWLRDDASDPVPELSPGWHHMGTTRMADSPATGVVDRNAKVFGVSNLFVAGSSVFPTSSFVNPTLTLLALTLRLADHLRAAAKREA